MCLAIPARIVELDGDKAVADAMGNRFKARTTLIPHARLGDIVLVHAGFAITIIDEEEAKKILDQLIRKKPDFAIAYYNRSAAKLKLNYSLKEVFFDLHKSITLNPILKDYTKNDPSFDSIRNQPCYECIIECKPGNYTFRN